MEIELNSADSEGLQALKLADDGLSATQIAKKFGISYTTVSNRIARGKLVAKRIEAFNFRPNCVAVYPNRKISSGLDEIGIIKWSDLEPMPLSFVWGRLRDLRGWGPSTATEVIQFIRSQGIPCIDDLPKNGRPRERKRTAANSLKELKAQVIELKAHIARLAPAAYKSSTISTRELRILLAYISLWAAPEKADLLTWGLNELKFPYAKKAVLDKLFEYGIDQNIALINQYKFRDIGGTLRTPH